MPSYKEAMKIRKNQNRTYCYYGKDGKPEDNEFVNRYYKSK